MTRITASTFKGAPRGLNQRLLSLGTASACATKNEWKNKLKAEAQRRFPHLNVTLKTADALLILEWGMARDHEPHETTRNENVLRRDAEVDPRDAGATPSNTSSGLRPPSPQSGEGNDFPRRNAEGDPRDAGATHGEGNDFPRRDAEGAPHDAGDSENKQTKQTEQKANA